MEFISRRTNTNSIKVLQRKFAAKSFVISLEINFKFEAIKNLFFKLAYSKMYMWAGSRFQLFQKVLIQKRISFQKYCSRHQIWLIFNAFNIVPIYLVLLTISRYLIQKTALQLLKVFVSAVDCMKLDSFGLNWG